MARAQAARRADEPDTGLSEALAQLYGPGHEPEEQVPEPRGRVLARYFQGIAEAHYVLRRVFRIVDEEAKRAGVDPLEHKVLIQIFAAPNGPLRVTEVAARMDIEPALASRLIKGLKAKGLVVSRASKQDGRIALVAATDEAPAILTAIDRGVRSGVARFQEQISDEERRAALQVFAFYLGAPPAA